MQQDIWQQIESLYQKLVDTQSSYGLKIHDDFLIDTVIAHSTAIEGSTLTEVEVLDLLHNNVWCKSRASTT